MTPLSEAPARLLQVSRIYAEPAARDSDRGRQVIDRFPDAEIVLRDGWERDWADLLVRLGDEVGPRIKDQAGRRPEANRWPCWAPASNRTGRGLRLLPCR